jgi:hypothetical protein
VDVYPLYYQTNRSWAFHSLAGTLTLAFLGILLTCPPTVPGPGQP